MTNHPWHVVEFRSSEGTLALIRLGEADYPTFYPRWAQRTVLYGRSVEHYQPLSPGLMFVRFDADDPVEWHNVRDCFRDAFRGFFGGARPVDVPERAFDALHILHGADAGGVMPIPIAENVSVLFSPGDRVRVLGALAVKNEDGFDTVVEGRVTWADARGARVVYQLLGRDIENYFPHSANALEKLIYEKANFPKQYGTRRGRKLKLYAEDQLGY